MTGCWPGKCIIRLCEDELRSGGKGTGRLPGHRHRGGWEEGSAQNTALLVQLSECIRVEHILHRVARDTTLIFLPLTTWSTSARSDEMSWSGNPDWRSELIFFMTLLVATWSRPCPQAQGKTSSYKWTTTAWGWGSTEMKGKENYTSRLVKAYFPSCL